MAFSFRRSKNDDEVVVDRVTGAFHRRQLDAAVAAGLDASGQPTATLVIDVDDFSSYNGKRGTASGDQVLERVSWVIMATVRTSDVVYRHDASSFCVLLPATHDVDALVVADRIRANVEKMPLLAESRVTVSVGVAAGPGLDLAATLQRADQALSTVEGTGPNQVVADPMASVSPSPVPVGAASSAHAASAPLAPPQPVAPPPAPAGAPATSPFAPPTV